MKTNEQIHAEALDAALKKKIQVMWDDNKPVSEGMFAEWLKTPTAKFFAMGLNEAIQAYITHISAAISEEDEIEAMARAICRTFDAEENKIINLLDDNLIYQPMPQYKIYLKQAKAALSASTLNQLVRGN